jgi:uncharacterized tellurite resistance protein B-like protein
MSDRIASITNLLLGAAYADNEFHEREKTAITKLLGDLVDGDSLPEEVTEQIEKFDSGAFDLEAVAGEFVSDSVEDKLKLIELIGAIHEADDEFDFAEDDYIREVGIALEIETGTIEKMTLDYEIEELKSDLKKLRATPPPVPGSAD